ncbi:MAG: phosphate propanoyltransferase [Defluviitaleaceae bacterium]|nr:phosphate propanoyltransferase [Defluviitaleaceae bacterium]
MNNKPIPIEVSARHAHLCEENTKKLFGEGYELKIKRELSTPGYYVVEERVDLATEKKELKNVGILTPLRGQTQIEISMTDARSLGINPPVRLSGDLAGSTGIKLTGPNGSVEIKEGVIIAKRHIHMSEATAEKYGIVDKQVVSVKTCGTRPAILEDVVVRIAPDFIDSMHIDTDEANACGIQSGEIGYIV